MKRSLITVVLLALTLLLVQAAPAATFTITINGTLGPVLSGSDPLGGNGATAMTTAMVSTTLVPTKKTSNSVTYSLAAGTVSAALSNGISFTNSAPWTMTITLKSTADTLVLAGPGPLTTTVSATSSLAKGSWGKTVLTHPTKFKPSPQNLTSPSSNLSYTLLGAKTVLGFNGTISN